MEEESIFKKLKPEEWNYEAKIIPREKIKDTIINVILRSAKNFVCLIAPFWTWKAVIELNLIDIFKELLKNNVKILLFGREDVPEFFHNIKIFNYCITKLNIRNCWLVKNLHSKLYYNEKLILLTSANITGSSLGYEGQEWTFNFEEAILFKSKPIPFEEGAWYTFDNLNPFEIPPFMHIQDFKDFNKHKNRFPFGYGYKEINKVEIPSIFSFPEMMKEWSLSTDSIKTYDREEIEENRLLHLGEKEDFCPICKDKGCDFSRTYICHKYGIEYKDMNDHCNWLECKFGPVFESITELRQRCPVTVFYCPDKNLFYDPAKNKLICRNYLKKAQYGEIWNPHFYEIDPDLMHKLKKEEDILSEECQNKDYLYFCSSCGTILNEDKENNIFFTDFDYRERLYFCPKCEKRILEHCPKCYHSYLPIDFSSSYFYCEYCNEEYHYHYEKC